MLVGNKLDIAASEREVPAIEGSRFAENFGVPFFEVSAKDGSNVNVAFETLVDSIVDKWNKVRTRTVGNRRKFNEWGGGKWEAGGEGVRPNTGV